MVALEQAITLGEIKPRETDPDGLDCETLLAQDKINVRFANERGQMPLHQLARFKLTEEAGAEKYVLYRDTFRALVAKMQKQAEKDKKSASIVSDVNYQVRSKRASSTHTPLHSPYPFLADTTGQGR